MCKEWQVLHAFKCCYNYLSDIEEKSCDGGAGVY